MKEIHNKILSWEITKIEAKERMTPTTTITRMKDENDGQERETGDKRLLIQPLLLYVRPLLSFSFFMTNTETST